MIEKSKFGGDLRLEITCTWGFQSRCKLTHKLVVHVGPFQHSHILKMTTCVCALKCQPVCKGIVCHIEPNNVSCVWNIAYDTLVRYTTVVTKWFHSILNCQREVPQTRVDILFEFVWLRLEWFDCIMIYKRSKSDPFNVCLNSNYGSKKKIQPHNPNI